MAVGFWLQLAFGPLLMGVRIRGTLGDIDPLNEVPFKRARSRVHYLGFQALGFQALITKSGFRTLGPDPQPQALSSKPGISNPKPETLKPEPQPDLTPKPQIKGAFHLRYISELGRIGLSGKLCTTRDLCVDLNPSSTSRRVAMVATPPTSIAPASWIRCLSKFEQSFGACCSKVQLLGYFLAYLLSP